MSHSRPAQSSADFHTITSAAASNNNANVDELARRLDQMNVHQAGAGSGFRELADSRLAGADSQERMSVDDDENVQPSGPDHRHHHRHPAEEPARQRAAPRGGESNILIVTNVDPAVFGDALVKARFESLFTAHDERVLFRYLKSFRRVRLDFASGQTAEAARQALNNYKLGNAAFKCYLAQMIRPNRSAYYNQAEFAAEDADMFAADDQQQQNNFCLSIPKPSKQFLISPPVSPPAGWKPHDEGSPCIDVQLISAIANLVPGQVHEIHPGNESQPGIFVEVCEESQYDAGTANKRIPKTANPIAAARKAIGQAMRSS